MSVSTPARVGIITLVGLIAIATIIIWKSEIFLIGRGYECISSFDNVEGLTLGSEVRFRGMKVGKVLKIDPGPYDIKVLSIIDPKIKIPSDSTLRVAYDGIVGLKFLEIRPGTSETMYSREMVLVGTRTSAIVDFIDIGSKNLEETRAILETVRKFMQDPALQRSVTNAVFAAEKLTEELRAATEGIKNITTDPKFQQNLKGTISETEKTLSSANRFFEGVGRVNLRASGGIDVGTRANAVRGDVDIIQSERTYYRIGFGEGPTRQPGLLDFLLTNKTASDFGYRLGVINSQLGGGVMFTPSEKVSVLADIYDINNPRPNWPRFRLGYEYEFRDYLDLLIQADDLLNSNNSNFSIGLRIKPIKEKLY